MKSNNYFRFDPRWVFTNLSSSISARDQAEQKIITNSLFFCLVVVTIIIKYDRSRKCVCFLYGPSAHSENVTLKWHFHTVSTINSINNFCRFHYYRAMELIKFYNILFCVWTVRDSEREYYMLQVMAEYYYILLSSNEQSVSQKKRNDHVRRGWLIRNKEKKHFFSLNSHSTVAASLISFKTFSCFSYWKLIRKWRRDPRRVIAINTNIFFFCGRINHFLCRIFWNRCLSRANTVQIWHCAYNFARSDIKLPANVIANETWNHLEKPIGFYQIPFFLFV